VLQDAPPSRPRGSLTGFAGPGVVANLRKWATGPSSQLVGAGLGIENDQAHIRTRKLIQPLLGILLVEGRCQIVPLLGCHDAVGARGCTQRAVELQTAVRPRDSFNFIDEKRGRVRVHDRGSRRRFLLICKTDQARRSYPSRNRRGQWCRAAALARMAISTGVRGSVRAKAADQVWQRCPRPCYPLPGCRRLTVLGSDRRSAWIHRGC